MSMLQKVFGLGLVGLALAASMPVDAKIAANKIAANKIAMNRLASNKVAMNRLSSNKIAMNTFAGNNVAGEGAFADVAAIELPNGLRLTR